MLSFVIVFCPALYRQFITYAHTRQIFFFSVGPVVLLIDAKPLSCAKGQPMVAKAQERCRVVGAGPEEASRMLRGCNTSVMENC